MRLLYSIQNFLRQRALRKRLADRHRTRVSGSLCTARDVLVLYDASEESQNKVAEKFFDELKSLNIKVKSIGFAKYKILPHYCIPQLSRQFICKKDIDILGVPHQALLNDFLDEEVDLLISLDQEQDPILQFLAALSMAHYKVGWNHPDNMPYFDCLIGGTDPGNVNEYISQLIHYLTLNSSS